MGQISLHTLGGSLCVGGLLDYLQARELGEGATVSDFPAPDPDFLQDQWDLTVVRSTNGRVETLQ